MLTIDIIYGQHGFMPGALIDDNICQAINSSKRTLCILTSDFINSPYCMREYELASHRNIELRKKRLIMAVLQLPDFTIQEISVSLKQYISSHTYLDCSSKDFRKHLLYAMPVSRLGQTRPTEDIAANDQPSIIDNGCHNSESRIKSAPDILEDSFSNI